MICTNPETPLLGLRWINGRPGIISSAFCTYRYPVLGTLYILLYFGLGCRKDLGRVALGEIRDSCGFATLRRSVPIYFGWSRSCMTAIYVMDCLHIEWNFSAEISIQPSY